MYQVPSTIYKGGQNGMIGSQLDSLSKWEADIVD